MKKTIILLSIILLFNFYLTLNYTYSQDNHTNSDSSNSQIFCPKCGLKNHGSANYCIKCGSKIYPGQENDSKTSYSNDNLKQAEKEEIMKVLDKTAYYIDQYNKETSSLTSLWNNETQLEQLIKNVDSLNYSNCTKEFQDAFTELKNAYRDELAHAKEFYGFNGMKSAVTKGSKASLNSLKKFTERRNNAIIEIDRILKKYK